MKKQSAWQVMAILLLTSALLSCTGIEEADQNETPRELPYYGTHDIILEPQEDGSSLSKQMHFQVPPFAFTNQSKREVSHKDYDGKVYVADFFFTTCPTICPVMSSQLSRLQSKLAKEGILGEVMILSHTVNPEHDSPEVLKAYAERMEADTNYWHFVTGVRDDIYDQAKYGYFLTALESDTAAGGLFHSDTFALIDQKDHIRGYYDGTSTDEVDQLFDDIKLLIKKND